MGTYGDFYTEEEIKERKEKRMEDNKLWAWIVGVIATAVVVLVLGLYSWHSWSKVKMMELGYEEVTTVGSSQTFYQKVR